MTDATRESYTRMTSSFFNFCASMRMPKLFHYEQITAFFEY